MNKILVVAKNKKTYFIERLTKEVPQSALSFYNPWADSPGDSLDVDFILCRTSGVYQDDKDLAYLQALSRPIVNPLTSLMTFRSKSSQYLFMEKNYLPCLPWLSIKDSSQEKIIAWASSFQELLVKPDRGQGGWGIKVLQQKEVPSWVTEQRMKKDLSWVMQPFQKQAREWRVFFIGRRFYTLMRKPEVGKITSNFQQGGKAQLVPLPIEIEEAVLRFINFSGTYYGAIDILQSVNGFSFIDFNVVPGFEQIEQLSGLNLVRELIEGAKYFCRFL